MPETLDIRVSSFRFDRSHPSLFRDRVGLPEERSPSFDDRYDFDTLFYDAHHDAETGDIILLCPPLLNFRRLLEQTAWRVGDEPLEISSVEDISRGSVVRLAARGRTGTLTLSHRLFEGAINVNPPSTERFRDRNVVHAISKDNQLEWIRDWLSFYVRAHDANAVILYDNGSTRYSHSDLARVVAEVPGLAVIAVVVVSLPFGSNGSSNSDYESLFLQRSMLELSRTRFLSSAGAVLNVDIDELFYSDSGRSVFEATRESHHGITRADAKWVYAPPAKGENPPAFTDHKFVSKSGRPKANRKWCVAPQGPLQGHQWRTHFVGSRMDPVDPEFVMWHFRQISSSWKYDRATESLPHLVEDAQLIAAMRSYFPT